MIAIWLEQVVMAEVTMIGMKTRGVGNLDISAARHDVMPAQPTKRLNAPTENSMSSFL
jgi:hypothetical protein